MKSFRHLSQVVSRIQRSTLIHRSTRTLHRTRFNRTHLLSIALCIVSTFPLLGARLPAAPMQHTASGSTAASVALDHARLFPPPPIMASEAALLDADTGQWLYLKNADQPRPMASTTKIMTALLAIQSGHLQRVFTVSRAAASIGESTMGLQEGQRVPLIDLLYGLLLPSGNDAAMVIADGVGGSQKGFVTMMNQRAAALGMVNTHYVTPHGLDRSGHYSSARDLAILARVAIQNPLLRRIAMTRHIVLPRGPGHPSYNLTNINYFAFWYPGADGVKPGQTNNAGLCLVESVHRNGRHLIGVVLNTPNLYTDIRDLFNYGYQDFTWIPSGRYGDVPSQSIVAGTPQSPLLYYPASGHSITSPVLTYFRAHGGLATLGYPLTESYVAGGQLIQQFSRATVSLNIGNVTQPPVVQTVNLPDPTALAAASLAPALPTLAELPPRLRQRVAPIATSASAQYIPESGHTLTWSFLWYYRDHGGAVTFGYPRTEKLWLKSHLVQYFDHALFVFIFDANGHTGHVQAYHVVEPSAPQQVTTATASPTTSPTTTPIATVTPIATATQAPTPPAPPTPLPQDTSLPPPPPPPAMPVPTRAAHQASPTITSPPTNAPMATATPTASPNQTEQPTSLTTATPSTTPANTAVIPALTPTATSSILATSTATSVLPN